MNEIYFINIRNNLSNMFENNVMCSSNLTTLRSNIWKNMGWNPVGINSLSVDGSYVSLSPIF